MVLKWLGLCQRGFKVVGGQEQWYCTRGRRKEASKQAGGQAGKPARMPASKQAGRQASERKDMAMTAHKPTTTIC